MPATGHLRNLSAAESRHQSGSTTRPCRRTTRTGMRSGNDSDLNSLPQGRHRPRIIGTQPVVLGTVTQLPQGLYQAQTVGFSFLSCASRLKAGDIIQQPGVFGEVTQTSTDPVAGTVTAVQFKIIFPPAGVISPGPAQVASVFDAW